MADRGQEKTMNTFEVDGYRVHYQTAGSGAPLVFAHGSAGSAKQWKQLYQHFSKTRQVLAYDLLGCGANEPLSPDAPRDAAAPSFSYRDDARVLAAIVERMGRPVDVIAHSAGGVGAIVAALDHPRAIRTLTLFEPVLFFLLRDSHDPAFEPVAAIGARYRTLVESGQPRAAMEAFVDFWNGSGSWQKLPEPIRQSMLVGVNRLYLEFRDSLSGERYLKLDDLARLRQPILYFCGERTIEPVKRLTHIALTRLPNCRFVTVPGANHMAPFTHAGDVLAEIESHVAIDSPTAPPLTAAYSA